jgi:glycosyltransferase involved in cell wall biosynthesis
MPADRLPAYAVVSPVRDEIADFARTAESLIAQAHRPRQWVIVDDGSTDGTRELAEAYARAHDWIDVIDSGAGHDRARGAPIVRAFTRGVAALRERPEVVVKLDGDLFLPAHYFAWVARAFADDERAGVVGGVVLVPGDSGGWEPDTGRQHAVNGVAKAYRSACLEEIGGLPASMGWDGIDEYAARARGWHVHVLTELPILHYQRRGSKQPWWRARWEEGRGARFMGYRWDFLALRAGYRMLVDRPRILGGLVLAAGFVASAARRSPQIADPAARALLRADQARRLQALVRPRAAARSGDHGAAPAGGGPAYTATTSSISDR